MIAPGTLESLESLGARVPLAPAVCMLGTAKVDITPPHPVQLAGYGWRKEAYAGVARRLFARCFWFRFRSEGEEAALEREALFVFADLICFGSDRMPHLRHALHKAFGLESEHVLVQGTHTHGGPQTSVYLSSEIGVLDEGYVAWLEDRLLVAAAQARENLEPISFQLGSGSFDLGIHRRRMENGRIVGKPNPGGPTDPEVTVYRFDRQDGSAKGLWFHYTCHPTIGDAAVVDAEFPGVAAGILEQELGTSVLPAFVQGCCGDVRPAMIADDAFYRGGDKDIQAQGAQLAEEVLRIHREAMQPAAAAAPQFVQFTVPLRFCSLPERELLEALATAGSGADQAAADAGLDAEAHVGADADAIAAGADPVRVAWSRTLLQHPERLAPTIELELTYIRLAEGLAVLAMNGEIVVEYGLRIKELFGPGVMPLGYSNGMIGYIPTARQIEEGGYEGGDAHVYFGLPAPFATEIEEQIMAGIDRLHRLGTAALSGKEEER